MITDLLAQLEPANGAYFTIAIDGRGGSGKSTLAAELGAATSWAVITGDDWFDPIDGELRWGDFNEPRFLEDVVDPIRQGLAPKNRPFDWTLGHVVDQGLHRVDTAVVVERVFSFTCGIDWDVRIWVETPRTVCLERARQRDLVDRERLEAVWAGIWQPNEDRFIAHVRPVDIADVVLDGTQPFGMQLESPDT